MTTRSLGAAVGRAVGIMQTFEERLAGKGLLSGNDIARAQDIARDTGKPLPTVLIEDGFLSEAAVLDCWPRITASSLSASGR